MDFSMAQLNGLIGESPKVIHAIATQTRDEQQQPMFVVVAFIRNSVPHARCAVTESQTSVHDAAKGMRDTLLQFGIAWDGHFKFCTPEELARLKAEATPPASGPIVAS